jgi:hypothetical protein
VGYLVEGAEGPSFPSLGCFWDPLGFFGSFDPLLLLLLVKSLTRSFPFGLKTHVLRVQNIGLCRILTALEILLGPSRHVSIEESGSKSVANCGLSTYKVSMCFDVSVPFHEEVENPIRL